MNRLSALWLIPAVCAGYFLSAPSVKADEKSRRLPYMINRGETVTLVFAYGTWASGGSSVPCTVVDESDAWVRCGSADEIGPPSREQRWYDLTRVVEIIRHEK